MCAPSRCLLLVHGHRWKIDLGFGDVVEVVGEDGRCDGRDPGPVALREPGRDQLARAERRRLPRPEVGVVGGGVRQEVRIEHLLRAEVGGVLEGTGSVLGKPFKSSPEDVESTETELSEEEEADLFDMDY